jgi:predicted esterase
MSLYPGHKPAILCLHGGGTNQSIFHIQMVRIQRILSSHFEFVYLDGPLIGAAGPDVLPVFEGLEPFRRWAVYGSSEKPGETDSLLREAMEARRKEDGRGFVGVVGFSQGAKTGAGLLLEQQLHGKDGEGLAFGVMLNGTSPPLTMGLSEEEKGVKIKTPALVVVGRDDPFREFGVELYEKHFEATETTLVEFGVGHRLPVEEKDTKMVTDWILRTWERVKGERKEDLSAYEVGWENGVY